MDKKTQALVEQYSKSLVEVAIENNQVESVQEDVAALVSVFETSGLDDVLSSLAVPHAEKVKFVRLFQESSSVYMNNFLEVILQNERESLLLAILTSVQDKFIHETDTFDVKVTTAVALTKKQKERIFEVAKDKLTIENGRLVEVVDESIIGGFIINANNKVIDASVRSQLRQFKMKLK